MDAFFWGVIGAFGPEVARLRRAGQPAVAVWKEAAALNLLHLFLAGLLAVALAREATAYGQLYIGISSPYMWTALELSAFNQWFKRGSASPPSSDDEDGPGDMREMSGRPMPLQRIYVAATLLFAPSLHG